MRECKFELIPPKYKISPSIEKYGFYLTQLFGYDSKKRERVSFPCLLVGCYTLDLFAIFTIGRSYICRFVQHFLIFCHGSVSTVPKSSPV